MSQATDRLRRYMEDELGECRNEDVQARLEEIASLERTIDEQLSVELDVLAALANETRYTLARALVAAREELCVCELQPLVAVSESGLSHALSELAASGLVESRKDGRWKKYRATNRAVAIVTVLEGTVAVEPASNGDSQ
ncbi:ArsR/SmtB family transcription factor [Halorhabdus utahensis]|nr:metalloregulator ArsR/SmtB family transcription factor [Halorhabdus utahensis]